MPHTPTFMVRGLASTLFATLTPARQAFEAALSELGISAEALLADVTTLKTILQYHVTTTVFFSPEFLARATSFKPLLSGKTLRVNST